MNKSPYQSLYVTAARGIQDFIFRSDKLKEMVGASGLVDSLTANRLVLILKKLCPDQYRILSNAAGGARILFKKREDAENLAKIWPVLVRHWAPGLQVVQAIVECQDTFSDTIDQAERQINHLRNYHFATLPGAKPLMAKVPRTGQPAAEKDGEDLVSRESRKKLNQHYRAIRYLAKGTLPDFNAASKPPLPEDFTKIAEGDNSYMAVIHADGNGLGKIILQLLDQLKTANNAEDRYANFCQSVDKAAKHAFQQAVAKVGKREDQLYPLIPLICAGDDVTLVIAAGKAMVFCHELASQFEIQSGELLGSQEPHLINGLTMAIGVAFVKVNYPFWQAYELAESLCAYAKKESKRQVSALAFYRVTTSLTGDYAAQIIPKNLSTRECRLTMNPYQLGKINGRAILPTLTDLCQLGLAQEKMPTGAVRELVTRMHQSKHYADQAYERIKEIHASGKKQEKLESANGKNPFPKWECALAQLTHDADTASQGPPLWQATELESGKKDGFRTPLFDAIELQSVDTEFKKLTNL